MVNSPTFILMNEHDGRLRLFHVDAYRLDDPEEALAAGLLDERQAAGVTVVEWADRLDGLAAAGSARDRDRAGAGRRSVAHRSRWRGARRGGTPRWRPRRWGGRDDRRHRVGIRPTSRSRWPTRTATLRRVDGWSAGQRQAHELLPRLLALLERTAAASATVTALAVGIGPGSFTGLRVGMSVAKGLAFALERPIVGVPSLAAWLASEPDAAAAVARAGARDAYLLRAARRRRDRRPRRSWRPLAGRLSWRRPSWPRHSSWPMRVQPLRAAAAVAGRRPSPARRPGRRRPVAPGARLPARAARHGRSRAGGS